MKILAIDTSCDETAAAVTINTEISSSVVWSQAALHASFGGVMPSLAQRQHEERIDWVVDKAIKKSGISIQEIDAVAVTVGNGLSIALGVGINKAKQIAIQYKKPLIPVSHTEAHLLSPLCAPRGKVSLSKKINITFPALGLVLSGGTTVLAIVHEIGKYEVVAETADDALGEALDKGARLLGLGYPGGAILEKLSRSGNPKRFNLPLPLHNDRIKNRFSYSGLKTAFVRMFDTIKDPNKQDIADLAASYQSVAFDHVSKILEYQVKILNLSFQDLLFGGGVANNIEIKKRLRKFCKKNNIKLHVPYTKSLNGDNAGMIGVCAYLKNRNTNLDKFLEYESVDRNPRLKLV